MLLSRVCVCAAAAAAAVAVAVVLLFHEAHPEMVRESARAQVSGQSAVIAMLSFLLSFFPAVRGVAIVSFPPMNSR